MALVTFMGASAGQGATRLTTASGGNWTNTLTWSGGIVPASTDNAVIMAGASVSVTANATANSIIFSNNAAGTATLTVNSGVTLTVTSGITNQNGGSLNTSVLIQGAGTINCASLTVGGTTTPSVNSSDYTTTLTSTVSNLTVSGSLSINALYNSALSAANQGVFALSSGTVTVNGGIVFVTVPLFSATLTLASGSQNGTLILSGSTPFTITGGGSSSFTANGTNTTVVYSGTAQTVKAATYQNLFLSGSGTKTTAGVTVNGILSMQGTATASAAPTYGANATLQYAGSAAQTQGPELPAIIPNFTINNAGGVTLTNNATVSNTLSLVGGNVTTAANKISIAVNGSISGGSPASYVNGWLEKNFNTGVQTFTYPVGDSSSYTPLALSNLSVTAAGSLKTSTTAGNQPQFGSSGIDPSRNVNRYWTLTQSGGAFGTYNATFNYVASDVDTNASPSQFTVRCWTGSAWSFTTVNGTPSATAASISGQSGYGDFVIGNPSPWFNGAWLHRVAITIAHTKVAGPLTNFPVLINITNSVLQQYAQTSGNDLLFTLGDGTTKLAHEVESYNSTNGALVAWVNVPLLSATADTLLYLYCGNSSATNQQNVAATWNSNFKGVWHMNNSLTDSTSNNNNGANTGTINAAGKISNGRGFVRSDGVDYITVTGLMGSSANLTLSAWINLNSLDTSGAEFISLGDHAGVRQDGTGIVGDFYDGSTWFTTPSTTNFVGTGWRHVAYTFNNGGHSQILYVDGVQIAASTYTNVISYGGYLGTNTIIGKHGNGATGFSFDGTMDEVRVSSTPRSAGWIATEFNNQNPSATFYSVGGAETHAATTNYLHFSTTPVGANTGPVNPANGATSFNGAGLAAGDLVVFDGLVIDTNPGANDAWGAVELNQKAGGSYGLTLAQLGVLTRYTSASANYCQLWTNGVAASNFPVGAGANTTNRVRIELTATAAGSTTNMNWVVKIDQGLAGAFTTTLSGVGVTFTNNTIGLTFGSYSDPSLFGDYCFPVITAQPTNQTVTAGGSVTFTVAASSFAPLSYRWYFNGGGISGATNVNYSLSNVMASNAGNYTVVITNVYGSVTSSVAALTVTKAAGTVALGNLHQTYNGSAEAATASTTPTGLTVNLTYNGSVNAPTNAGSYTVVGTINDANYQGGATNTLAIANAAVTVSSGLSANNKIYDGMTTTTLSFNNVVLSGVAAGDTANVMLSMNGYTAAFTSATVGTNKMVTVSGLTLTGSAAANYTLTQPGLTASITAAALTVTANSTNRSYGAANPTFTVSYNGFVAGEDTSVVSGAPLLTTPATTNSPVLGSPYPITISHGTLSAINYSFNLVNGNLTVTPAPLTVIADDQSRAYGTTNPVLTASYNGFVNGEGTNALSGSPALSTAATTNSPAGTYPIQTSLGTLSSANYAFNLSDGTLTIIAVLPVLTINSVAGMGSQPNQFILQGAGVTPDSIWHVQAATNLLQWVEIGTVQAAGDGTITFTDTNTLQYPMRFYRLSGN